MTLHAKNHQSATTDDCLSYIHENEFIKLSMGMPASVRSWKCYEDNVLYCILLQVAFQFEKPQILMIKHFTRHQKDLQPHALGGNCYRHISALQPQSHISINQGASKSLKVLFHTLKEQGQLITSSPRSSPWKTTQNWSKQDHTDCPMLRVRCISPATCKKCDAYWNLL